MTVAGMIFGCPHGQAQNTTKASHGIRFDAAWWDQADSKEQMGFIVGYIDCRLPPHAANAPMVDYQNFVSKVMDSKKPGETRSVTAAIKRAEVTLKPPKPLPGGEVSSGPHGSFDGSWWGVFPGPRPLDVASSDMGYVEGYLECVSPPVTVQKVRWYQNGINKYYDHASDAHLSDAIADVLQRLLKPAANSKK